MWQGFADLPAHIIDASAGNAILLGFDEAHRCIRSRRTETAPAE